MAFVRTDASLPLSPAGVAVLDDVLRAVADWWHVAPVPAVVTLVRLGCEVLRPAAPMPPDEFARRLRRSDPLPPSPVAG